MHRRIDRGVDGSTYTQRFVKRREPSESPVAAESPEHEQSTTFIFGYSSQSRDLRNAILKTTENKQIIFERSHKLVLKQECKKDKYRGPKLVRANED